MRHYVLLLSLFNHLIGRELDLSNIAGIVLFACERKNSLQIELSDIYLKTVVVN